MLKTIRLPEDSAAAAVAVEQRGAGSGVVRTSFYSSAEALALHEALGELLGVRPISPELAEGLWTMYQTAQGSAGVTAREAFIDVLTNGLKYSARGVPAGTNAPRPLDPISPSLEPVHDETGCHVARLCAFRRAPFCFTRGELVAVRDAADEILEDRSRADLVAILNAVEGNPATAATTGIKPGRSTVEALKKWAGSYRAPEPSADLKEALSAALRSYSTLYPSLAMEAASDLFEVFGQTGHQSDEELDRLADHLAEAVASVPAPPALRPGQCAFNALLDVDPAAAEAIRSSEDDPFHNDSRLPQFLRRLRTIWSALPALSAADVGALRWAVERAIEVALPANSAPMRERAMAAAGRLTARPALSAREATAIQLCAAYAQMAAENMAEAASERALAHASTALATVDRLTGAPGSPTAGDPPEPTEGKDDEPCAGAAQDRRAERYGVEICGDVVLVVDRTVETEGDLRPGHPAVKLVFATLEAAQEAVDRLNLDRYEREERVPDFDHLDPEAVLDQILDLRRRLEYLERHLARVPVVEGRLKIQGARLDALEMHRRGLSDGTAEMAAKATAQRDRLLEIYRREISSIPVGAQAKADILRMLYAVAASKTMTEAAGRLSAWAPEDKCEAIAAQIWDACGV